MADSAPDPKVEDVLSSVRRLVSGEIPKRAPPVIAGDDGALVLSQSDRIEADPQARVAARSLEQRIAELEAAVDSGTEEFEPDGSEDQAQHIPDRIVYTRPPKSQEEADMRRSTLRLSEIALIETGPANDDEGANSAQVTFRHGEGAMSLAGTEAPMAEDVPTLPAACADVTAFTNPDDVVERIEARIKNGAPVETAYVVLETSVFEDTPDESGDAAADGENMLREDAPEVTVDPEAAFDEALTEAVQASIASAGFEGAGDAKSPDDQAGSTPDTSLNPDVLVLGEADVAPEDRETAAVPTEGAQDEASEADTIAASEADLPDSEPTDLDPEEPATEAAQDAEPAMVAAALADLSDEEAMRLLVARLIREELQGDLGERITRNVRKLVRREIMRALDSRDLV